MQTTLKLPRYRRLCFDETSVYFKNAGKLRTKEFLIYSKFHERLANGKDAAKGLIRLENSHRKSAVNRLAKSLNLPNHTAKYILTKETSETVIQTAMKQLHFDSLLTAGNSNVEKLFEIHSATMPLTLIGFLYLKDKFGDDLTKQPFINISPKTLKRYLDETARI